MPRFSFHSSFRSSRDDTAGQRRHRRGYKVGRDRWARRADSKTDDPAVRPDLAGRKPMIESYYARPQSSPMLSIRPACPEDFDAIGQIFHEAIHQLAARDYTKEQLQAWAGDKRSAEHWRTRTTGLEVRIALVENSPAGFIGYSRTGHIDLLFTHPAYARHGIARALLLDAERDLLHAKVSTAWTEASLTARPFFQSMGYRVVRGQTVNCNGIELRNFRMDKPLLPPGR